MTRTLVRVAALLTALAAAAPAAAGQIAFLRGKATAAGGQVYSISDHGGKERLVAGLTAINLGWSPAAKLFAFTQVKVDGKTKTYDVWVVGSNGKGLHRITKDGSSGFVTWARGRLVVNRGGKLLVLAADGSRLGKLPATFGSADELAWSADGRRIAYTSAGRLFSADAHGKNRHALTPVSQDFVVANPSWSPGGDRVAFSVITQKAVGQGLVQTMAIWTVGADGKGVRRITSGNVQDAAPSWSPDGRRIAFMRSPIRGGTHSDLWVVGADGHDVHELTRSPSLDALPVWRR
jgi:Tol biopolymer transport system component